MKRKKAVLAAVLVAAALALIFLAGTGFRKRTDVALCDYAVSEDGTKLTFQAQVMSSMGYIRGFSDDGGGVRPHYLTFFSTFGGLNSAWRAANVFELELDAQDTEIFFCRPGGGYELVLIKNEETGEWARPQ